MTARNLRLWIFVLLATLTVATGGAFAADDDSYVLGPGDRVKIVVFDEPDLSGDFTIGDVGAVSMPLLGDVKIGGLTTRGSEKLIETRLRDGYLKHPRVSVSVQNARPFYILGEVNKPGEYSYVTRMTILNAVALAGGFTYRANEKTFILIRAGDPERKEVEVPVNTAIGPGDVVRVKERFF